jgi:hypothetical protein
MGIKRYKASEDNTITNAFKHSLTSRGYDANMGASDILEVFSIYGQATTSSVESARILVRFPVTDISADRTSGDIPAKGDVSFYLRMYNAKHSQTLPRDYTLSFAPVSQSWSEGGGVDMDEYKDKGFPTITGSTWMTASYSNAWTTPGGDYYTGASTTITFTGGCNTNEIITIISTDTTSKAYKAASSTDVSKDPPEFNHSGPADTIAAALKTCIESANGHSGKITVSAVKNGAITLTQATAGTAGNTTITENLNNCTVSTKDDGSTLGFRSGGSITTQTFTDGPEDVEVDITTMVEEWIASARSNYGVHVKLADSQEAYVEVIDKSDLSPAPSVQSNAAGAKRSYYTKKFHGRTSEFFFKRPVIEARWDGHLTDDRSNFYYSSSLGDIEDNRNTLYLYNFVRGRLKNIKGIGKKVAIYVSLYSGSVDNSAPTGSKLSASGDTKNINQTIMTNITGGYAWQGTGIYTASFALTGNTEGILTKVFDVWHNASGSVLNAGTVQYATGTFNPMFLSASLASPNTKYIVSMPDLQSSYDANETVRFRVSSRMKYWQPNNYTVASSPAQNMIIESGSYKIYRVKDDLEIIKHCTGSSDGETLMSYDRDGNFFDLDMKLLKPDVAYGIEYAYYDGDKWAVQKDRFKFRVEKKE